MAVAIYVRVSTEEQRERQSILTQREFGDRFCDLHQITVHRIYSDDGVSGTIPLDLRPEGGQILRDAKLRKFDQLLVYRLDRLGRETRLILNAVDTLEKLGVRVRSMTEEFDTGSASGRLMLTMLSGFASHERDVIRERSVAGTQRVAEGGAWLGGIVPYGYRKIGEKRDAHLVISEEPIPGLEMSEAEVIRDVFRMASVEKKSCPAIAMRLNELGVPCAYVRDDRLLLRGKRKQRTSGMWRPGRIRGLITNQSYKGIHEYGKRTTSARPVVSRPVPLIVSAETWQKAQANLKAHMLFGKRSARNQYLLRGLIKCALCGLTYVGVAINGRKGFHYRCNGAHSPAIYRPHGPCGAKSVRGDILEQQVWSDVESFLRNPEPVLQQLHTKLEADSNGSNQFRDQITRLEGVLAQKAAERARVVSLFRRGRLNETDLDAQMDEIGKEQTALEAQIDELRSKIIDAESITVTVSSAQTLLAELRKRLDEPISWEVKRRLVEVLVSGIRVDTVENCGVKQSRITVNYRFSEPGQPMPVVLPQSYTGGIVRIPVELNTIGDHLRRRRLALKMLQKEVGKQIGVDKCSIHNWEANTSNPDIQYVPAIIEFLGYNPIPPVTGWGPRLIWQRTTLGLTQRDAAKAMEVDPGTLQRWEHGEREPTKSFVARVNRFLSKPFTKVDSERKPDDDSDLASASAATTSPARIENGVVAVVNC